MQYILSEEEYNSGAQLVYVDTRRGLSFDDADKISKELIKVGFFVIINDIDSYENLCEVQIYKRKRGR